MIVNTPPFQVSTGIVYLFDDDILIQAKTELLPITFKGSQPFVDPRMDNKNPKISLYTHAMFGGYTAVSIKKV